MAGYDGVDEAVFQHELGGLEAWGEVLVGGFFNDAWASEADHAFWLGDVDVTDGGEGSGDAAGGGMRENGDVWQAGFAEFGECAAGFRHLHEREHAFLHACAGGGGNDYHSAFFGDGGFNGAGDFFPDNRTHGPGKEFEIHHRDHGGFAVDVESAGDDGVVHFCALAETVDFIFVACKVQRVCGEQTGIGFLEAAGIGEEEDAIHGV